MHGSSPALREDPIEIPADWAALPSSAHWEPDNVLSGHDEGSWGTSEVISQATLGSATVRYRVEQCAWGGSACAFSTPRVDDISWGSLGVPTFPIAFVCEAWRPDALRWTERDPPPRGCRPESFVVRSDGTRFVLTIRSPETVETPLAAIARSPVRILAPRSTPAWPSHRVLLVAFAGLLLALGGHSVARTRRLLSMLSWTPSAIAGVEVLVDPRAPRAGTAYRGEEPLARRYVFIGSLAAVDARATLAVRIALVLCLASAVGSVVGAIAY